MRIEFTQTAKMLDKFEVEWITDLDETKFMVTTLTKHHNLKKEVIGRASSLHNKSNTVNGLPSISYSEIYAALS